LTVAFICSINLESVRSLLQYIRAQSFLDFVSGGGMDVNEIATLMRGFERVAIVFVSGIAIYMGAKLFLKGVVTEQSAEIEGAGWKLKLIKVGPGIFFALFGSSVLIYSVTTKLDISNYPSSSGEDNGSVFSLAYSTGGVLNTFAQIAEATKLVENSEAGTSLGTDLSRANALLQKSRREMVYMYFGPKVFEECPQGGERIKYEKECGEIAKWH
jgi:hypothetical protein